VHAGGDVQRPWWKTEGPADYGGTNLTLVIEKDLFAGAHQETFLSALRNQYGERGLQVCLVDADGEVARRNRFLQIDPTVLDRVPPSPVLQIWTSGECIFDGSGRRVGLDIVRQLVQKHFDGEVDNSVAYGGETCDSNWFAENWINLEYHELDTGDLVAAKRFEAAGAVMFVVPGSCSKCAFTKHVDTIYDLAAETRARNSELFILARAGSGRDIADLVGDFGTMVEYSGAPGSGSADLRTRNNNSPPFICRFNPDSNSLEVETIAGAKESRSHAEEN